MTNYQPKPTVFGLSRGFTAPDDAQALRAAMKGLGTDEQTIIDILCFRNNQQRQKIADVFKTEFGRDLTEDLKSELGGKFEKVILGLMLPVPDYLATQLHGAMSKLGTDEDVLVEVLCTRNNQEIKEITDAYLKLYGRTVEHDVTKDTSGDFRRLLVLMITTILQGSRHEEEGENQEEAEAAAQILNSAGEGKLGTDEEAFNGVLAHNSFQQLRLIFEEYKKLTGRTLEQAIKAELSGELRDGLLAIVKSVVNRPQYFAEKLKKAMDGFGADDDTIIRIIVSRSEIDLGNIEDEFESANGKTLESALKGETSGDYRKALIALLGPR